LAAGGDIRVGVRLFNRGADKTLPLISVLRLLVDDLFETHHVVLNPFLEHRDNGDEAMLRLILRMSRPEYERRLRALLFASFFAASRDDFVETTWSELAMPQYKDINGRIPPQHRLKPRVKRPRRGAAGGAAAAAAEGGAAAGAGAEEPPPTGDELT